jgi:hypothetical protein
MFELEPGDEKEL